jgi:GNAT superfamily N-acetyltransferase
MTELELELRALGAEIAVPATPDVTPAVARRIHRRRTTRRLLVAIAVAAAAFGIALAVPPGRSAILRFFHLQGVTVERVDTLPARRARGIGRALGASMPLAAAERRLGFRFRLPPGARPADARVIDSLGTVVLEHDGSALLLSEFRGDVFNLLKKVAGPSTTVAEADVGGRPGIWVEGATHFLYLGRNGAVSDAPIAVHGNVLLWQRGGLIYRLQGQIDEHDATRIAESVR